MSNLQQQWMVTAYGAKGGASGSNRGVQGKYGAKAFGIFELTKGETLFVVAGQHGGTVTSGSTLPSSYGGGGGGTLSLCLPVCKCLPSY